MPGSKKTYESSNASKAPVVPIGEEQGFDYHFRKYYRALSWFARSIIHNEEEAKDIVQDCFIKLWDDAAFIEKADYMKSLLYTAVRNRCMDYIRKQKVRSKAVIRLQTNEADTEHFDELAFAEMVRLVLKHVDDLPAHLSTILNQYYLQGKKIKEIAEDLSSTENAIQLQKGKAIKLLKEKLLLLVFLAMPGTINSKTKSIIDAAFINFV